MNKKVLDSMSVLLILLMTVSVAISGCNSGAKQDESGQDFEEGLESGVDQETQEKFQTAKRIFYSLPSPIETAKILQNAGASYDEALLNPVSNSGNYITTKSMALNLGIYTTNLSYASLFDQTQVTLNYIEVAKQMADGLNILDAIDDATIQRLEDNINNREVIIDIISETLLNSSSYLKERGLESTATIILVGGWIEGLHIATSLVGEDELEGNKIVKRIVDQKLSLDIMISLLEEAADDPDAQEILADVMELKKIFDRIEITQGENTAVTDPETNITTLKSESSYRINRKEFDDLAAKVQEIRLSYIS